MAIRDDHIRHTAVSIARRSAQAAQATGEPSDSPGSPTYLLASDTLAWLYLARPLEARDRPTAVSSRARTPPAATAAVQGALPPPSRPPPPVGGGATGVGVTPGSGVTAGVGSGVGMGANLQVTSTLCKPDAQSGDGEQR